VGEEISGVVVAVVSGVDLANMAGEVEEVVDAEVAKE
jgi:hypothetical protein